jgi:hypothetical protein
MRSAAVRSVCSQHCCGIGLPGASQVITSARIVKGYFKHAFVDVEFYYQAPRGYAGLVDLIPVVRNAANPATGAPGWSVISPDVVWNGLPASGSGLIRMRAHSTVRDGEYSIELYVTPATYGWSGRFAAVSRTPDTFPLISEQVQRAHSGDGAFGAGPYEITCPSGGCRADVPCREYDPACWKWLTVPIRYKSFTPVKFGLQLRCDDPTTPKCDNAPRFVSSSTLAPMYANSTDGEWHSATLRVKMFTSIDQSTVYNLQVAMGLYHERTLRWTETRDRSPPQPLFFVEAPAPGAAQRGLVGSNERLAVESTTLTPGDEAGQAPAMGWFAALACVALLAIAGAMVAARRFRHRSTKSRNTLSPVEGTRPPTAVWAF